MAAMRSRIGMIVGVGSQRPLTLGSKKDCALHPPRRAARARATPGTTQARRANCPAEMVRPASACMTVAALDPTRLFNFLDTHRSLCTRILGGAINCQTPDLAARHRLPLCLQPG